MKKIGEIIKTHRQRANLTVHQLASKIRVGTATIEKYEASLKTPDVQTLLRLSTVLDIPASEFSQVNMESVQNQLELDEELLSLIEKIGIPKTKEILHFELKQRNFVK
ncbi:helix-turn-helix domain-containing protein [Sutcliffiella sp. NC1]|uniref:helix-turn-helix domain-containing protein n=1 Tax=Sutcliffiella sp. NC1 TaxID=3004096 RepID=UPI0022DD12E2|nr:helix-turn-helix transcriptional regulator [Sutcliffiella sp. NC1]WBL14296.1 helix-turn-helix transcriptional regulator [Sutcliffiella sp. NC1]